MKKRIGKNKVQRKAEVHHKATKHKKVSKAKKPKSEDVSAIIQKLKEKITSERGAFQEMVGSEEMVGAEGSSRKLGRNFVKTGIQGFDELVESGVPEGASVLIA